MVQIVVIAKEPLPGRVKTRLCPPLTLTGAARVATASLGDTLATVRATPAARRVVALEGGTGPWLPKGFDVVPQCAGGLGARLDAAFRACFTAAAGPVVLVGMDTPQVTAGHLRDAADPLVSGRTDAVLGPAVDGGYWLIGLRSYRAGLFEGVPMSTADTGAAQQRRLEASGCRVTTTARLRDVDTFEDALAVAAACPDSAFARCVREVAHA